jgi:hypothetical protein
MLCLISKQIHLAAENYRQGMRRTVSAVILCLNMGLEGSAYYRIKMAWLSFGMRACIPTVRNDLLFSAGMRHSTGQLPTLQLLTQELISGTCNIIRH